MNQFIKVNSKMNMSYNVHKDVLLDTVKKIFNDLPSVSLVGDIDIDINTQKNNVSYTLSYKIAKNSDFVFETKNLMFLIDQKVFSLINTKPTNVCLKFCGEI